MPCRRGDPMWSPLRHGAATTRGPPPTSSADPRLWLPRPPGRPHRVAPTTRDASSASGVVGLLAKLFEALEAGGLVGGQLGISCEEGVGAGEVGAGLVRAPEGKQALGQFLVDVGD